jgi:hypothetical protein
MSQENVERYRQAARAFNDGDLDALLAVMDPEVEGLPRLAPIGDKRALVSCRGTVWLMH